MPDTFSKEKRSEIMSKIRSKDTKIEIKVRHWLYHQGIRYRKNCNNILGKPDIAIKKHKIAIFVHGCFWHGHENCKLSQKTKTRVEYWNNKINKNISRDQNIIKQLNIDGWHTFVLWECQIKSNFEVILRDLLGSIEGIKKEKK